MVLATKDYMFPRGYVRWELYDELNNKIIKKGKSNVITNFAREKLASAYKGDTVTFPSHIGIGTGTSTPAAGDTALQTPVNYDGVNAAKTIDSKSVIRLYATRFVTQFLTTEANQNIRELGLFDAANSGNLWARVSVTINKVNTQRLTVYWYLTFERGTGVPVKTGASIGATGTITSAVDSTATFASQVTFCIIENNTGDVVYVSISDAMSGTPPNEYDYRIANGSRIELLDEEFGITDLHIYKVAVNNFSLPNNALSIRGW